jgi:tetratricopeptide (TPR) repeat protein
LAANLQLQIVIDGWSDEPDDSRRLGVALARRALRAAPDEAEVIGAAAVVLSGLAQERAAARTLAEQAISLNPGSAMAWLTSGFLLLMGGETDRAVEQLETSMRLDPLGPNRPRQLVCLGGARFAQGRYSDAVTLLKEAVHQWEIPGALVMLAAAYAHLGDFGAARATLDRCSVISPMTLDVLARSVMRAQGPLEQLLDVIALTEGRSPRRGRCSAQYLTLGMSSVGRNRSSRPRPEAGVPSDGAGAGEATARAPELYRAQPSASFLPV